MDDGSPHDPHELTAAANVMTVLALKDDPSKSWSCGFGRIICTRLLEHVLASAKVPDDRKLQLVETAKSSAAAKKWKAEYDEKRAIVTAPTEERKLSAAELESLTPAVRNARRRQQTLKDRTVQKLSAAQIVAIHYALVTFFYICRIPFAVIEHWAFVALVDALCPAYTSQLFGRHALSSTWMDKLYDETAEKIESKLDQAMGRKNVIIDGFKDVRKRHVMNISLAKVGIATYAWTAWFGKRSHSGSVYAAEVKTLVADGDGVIAACADNTTCNTSMVKGLFGVLSGMYYWFFIGCCVHCMDLLAEDVAHQGMTREMIIEVSHRL